MTETPQPIADHVDRLLAGSVFGLDPQQHEAEALALFQAELDYAAERDSRLRRYFDAWPVDYRTATRVADLPYLPVGLFKSAPPLALVEPDKIMRLLASSATTGQSPSRIVLDAETSKRMTRGVMAIIRDFIGPARRPYLVIDSPRHLARSAEMGARAAAIQGLRSFATEIYCCLRDDGQGHFLLDEGALLAAADRWGSADILAYGFTHVVWQQFVLPLRERGIRLHLPNVRLLHSGGWKKLQDQAVSREEFAQGVAEVFGCPETQITDFYGMVENVGVVYPDCPYGNKHVPAFADVIVRDPLTLRPVHSGEQGLIQVCSVLPASFPGYLLLTEDIAEIVAEDGCRCGRRGLAFRFVKRAPKAEVRGCGNLEVARDA